MGDGNIHFNLEQPEGADPAWFLAQDHAIMDAVNEVVRDLDGSFSAEHGIGKLKPYMMPDWRGGAELALMQRIKAALDPRGIMNPGNVASPSFDASTTASVRLCACSTRKIAARWIFTVPGPRSSVRAISFVERPSWQQTQHVELATGEARHRLRQRLFPPRLQAPGSWALSSSARRAGPCSASDGAT